MGQGEMAWHGATRCREASRAHAACRPIRSNYGTKSSMSVNLYGREYKGALAPTEDANTCMASSANRWVVLPPGDRHSPPYSSRYSTSIPPYMPSEGNPQQATNSMAYCGVFSVQGCRYPPNAMQSTPGVSDGFLVPPHAMRPFAHSHGQSIPDAPSASATINGIDGAYSSSTSTEKKASRAKPACDYCRTRKVRCDGTRPCAFCTEKKVDCVYTRSPPPSLGVQEALNEIRQQIDGCQETLRDLNKRLEAQDTKIDALSNQGSRVLACLEALVHANEKH
ncbi:hypothetical protein RJ035_007365 [Blastomyces gilchristii]